MFKYAVLVAALPLLAAQTCDSSQYFSPNGKACMDKKAQDAYCNAVQKCKSGLACVNARCKPAGFPRLPDFTRLKDSSTLTPYSFGDSTNELRSSCKKNAPVDACAPMIIKTGTGFEVNWDFDYPAYLYPNGTVQRWTSTLPPGTAEPNDTYFQGLGVTMPFNQQHFRSGNGSPAYNTSVNGFIIGPLFEQEIFGNFFELDETTGYGDASKPNVLFSWARVITDFSFGVRQSPPLGLPEINGGGACFARASSDTATAAPLCTGYINWQQGGMKVSRAVLDSRMVSIPAGSYYRFTEVLDFSKTDQNLWDSIQIDGKLLSELGAIENVPFQQFNMAMNLKDNSDINPIIPTNGDIFDLNMKFQGVTLTDWSRQYTLDSQHEITIRGRKVYIATYESIGAGIKKWCYFAHGNCPGQAGAGKNYMGTGLYTMRYYPYTIPVRRASTVTPRNVANINLEDVVGTEFVQLSRVLAAAKGKGEGGK